MGVPLAAAPLPEVADHAPARVAVLVGVGGAHRWEQRDRIFKNYIFVRNNLFFAAEKQENTQGLIENIQ